MIKFIDIQNHITKKLKENFPNHTIYTDDNQTKPRVPAFYVSVRPLSTDGAMRYSNKIVNVNIMYLSARKTNREELIMADKLEDLFNLVLKVKHRKLHIESLSISELDGVLNLGFTLDYNTDFKESYEEGATEYMERLEISRGDD